MNGLEIHNRIEINNKKIQAALNKFILTDEINTLMQENEKLRLICPHEFKDGFCKYCGVPIELVEDSND